MVPTLFDHLNERREIAKTIPTLYFHESPHEWTQCQFDVFQISFCNQPALHVIFGKMRQVIECWPKKPRSTQFAKILLDQEFSLRFTGESSATRYCTIAQGGPLMVAVSDLRLVESILSLTPENVPSFVDTELIETQDDSAFFANERDDDRVRYASRVQTWLELNSGDAR